MESNDGTRLNVWVQEAASCDMPMDVGSFGAPVDFEVIDDADAFNWDGTGTRSRGRENAQDHGALPAPRGTWPRCCSDGNQ